MDWKISDAELTTKIRDLGKGRFGSVRLTKWRGTLVAVKTFQPPGSEKVYELHMKEFHTMIRLHHPGIVQTLGYVEDPFGIVMEYVEGPDLESLILKPGRRLHSSIRLKIMKELLCAVAYIHERKPEMVIHRDIKPSNILIQQPGYRVKLGDFGVSRFIMDTSKPTSFANLASLNINSPLSENVGTLRYMAPEVYRDKRRELPQYGHKIDIWSTAMVFYLLWEKKRPLPTGYTDDMSVIAFRHLLYKGHRPPWHRTPPMIRSQIERGWQIDPTQRPSAMLWLDAIEHIPPQYCYDFWELFRP